MGAAAMHHYEKTNRELGIERFSCRGALWRAGRQVWDKVKGSRQQSHD
jgi:hypothetical protein